MIDSLHERFSFMEQGIRGLRTLDKIGTVRKVTGLVIEAEGPEVSIGQVCSIHSERHDETIEAQVVGFRGELGSANGFRQHSSNTSWLQGHFQKIQMPYLVVLICLVELLMEWEDLLMGKDHYLLQIEMVSMQNRLTLWLEA